MLTASFCEKKLGKNTRKRQGITEKKMPVIHKA